MMIEADQIPEHVVEGKRLGRHVRHDPRSLRFPFRASGPLVSRRWSVGSTPILNQGDIGSCTGNATVAALMCSPFKETLSSEKAAALDEDLAIRIYSRATETDPFPGSYKPDDTGSSGLDAAKAAKEFGYISGYNHAFTLADALAALSIGPVIIGVNWTSGMDRTDSTGMIASTGSTRGGHEVCLDEINTDRGIVWLRNSWGSRWGVQGRASMTFTTLGQLLDSQGDATVFTPLTVEPPAPVPLPDADKVLAESTREWADARHAGTNRLAAKAVKAWRVAKGL